MFVAVFIAARSLLSTLANNLEACCIRRTAAVRYGNCGARRVAYGTARSGICHSGKDRKQCQNREKQQQKTVKQPCKTS